MRRVILCQAHSKIPLLQKSLISTSKTENARNQIPLRQKDAPFNGESDQHNFANGLWRETKKLRISSFCSCTISSSQVSFDTMLDFIIQARIMILGSLTQRITCTAIKHKRQETQRIFLEETIKEKTPNFLRDRINTKSKTQKE